MPRLPFHRVYRLGIPLWAAYAIGLWYGGGALAGLLFPDSAGSRGWANRERIEVLGRWLWFSQVVFTAAILSASVYAIGWRGTGVRWYWSWPAFVLSLLYLALLLLAAIVPAGIVM